MLGLCLSLSAPQTILWVNSQADPREMLRAYVYVEWGDWPGQQPTPQLPVVITALIPILHSRKSF